MIDYVNPVIWLGEEEPDANEEWIEKDKESHSKKSQQQLDEATKQKTQRTLQEYRVDWIIRSVMRGDRLH